MSGMLAAIEADTIHVMADAAFYDPDTGILSGIANKIWQVPRIDAVFVSRGVAAAFPLFADACETAPYETFDGFLHQIEEIFQRFAVALEGHGGEIMIAGWSEEKGEPLVLFWNNHTGYDGIPSKTVVAWREGRIQFGLELLPESCDAFDAIADGLPAFEAGRRCLNDLYCGERDEKSMGHAIGGAVSYLALRRDGNSEARIVHTWDDLVGERIDPFRLDAAAA